MISHQRISNRQRMEEKRELRRRSEDHNFGSLLMLAVTAGDSFMAALMVGLARGTDTQKALENACRVGAFVASHDGATPVLSSEIIQQFKGA